MELNDLGQIEVKLDRRVILRSMWYNLHKKAILNGYTWNDYCDEMRMYEYKVKSKYCNKCN